MKIKIIVAIDKKNGIGKDNKIPWYLPNDLKYFSKLTIGNGNNAILMGRKTYESIGKPLPNRINLVISSRIYHSESTNLKFISNLDSIEKVLNHYSIDTLWIIGGASIYENFLARPQTIDEVYVTEIDNTFNCDTFFPTHNLEYFKNCEIINTETSYENKITYKKFFS